jgi:hypothetical protein
MPVVEKIESLGYWLNRIKGDVWIVDNNDAVLINNTNHQGGIEAVYNACIEFIKWYNDRFPRLVTKSPEIDIRNPKKKAEMCLTSEVETYNQYLTGDVYGFKLIKLNQDKVKMYMELYEVDKFENIPDEDLIDLGEEDSCWGFYGTDWKENGIADNIPSEYKFLIDELK